MTRTLLAALAAVLLLAGCTSGEAHPEQSIAPSPPSPTVDYVALGDSYSAGPLISTVRSDPSECGRSTNNYPAFLADWLAVRSYRDVTCSGASTRDLTRRQSLFDVRRVPPQLAALSEETDLVTVGLGGNDFDIFSTLSGCAQRPDASGLEELCVIGYARLERDAGRVEERLERGLRRVVERAPHADVYVVGYPRVVPERGTCAAAGLTEAHLSVIARVQRRLNASLQAAARSVGADYVDLWRVSAGHDVCAGDDAWVNGEELLLGRAAPFHPFLAGMRGAAAEVYRVMTGEEPPEGELAEPERAAVVRNAIRR